MPELHTYTTQSGAPIQENGTHPWPQSHYVKWLLLQTPYP
jgi:hypothetical protein